MKIAYLHQYFCTPQMSGGTRSYEFARRLAGEGHEVHVVTTRQDGTGSGWDIEEVDGIFVHWLANRYNNRMGVLRRVWSFLAFSAHAAARTVKLDADVNLATSTPLTIAVPALVGRIARRTPYVFEVRDLWPEMPIAVGLLRNRCAIRMARLLERAAYKGATRIVALSPGMARGVIDVDGRPDVVAMIPNSCDSMMADATVEQVSRFRTDRPWLQDRPLVVYAGTLGVLNNVDYLVDLAALVKRIDKDVRFLVVGDGARKGAIEARARSRGVLGETFFIEAPIAKAEVPTLMGAADVACALFAPIVEMEKNSSNKFFDGLASGTPVLVNYGGWHRELIKSHGAGLAFQSEPSEDEAFALVRMVRDDRARLEAAAAARVLAAAFDRDVLFQKFRDTLVDAGARGRP
jgi:glycosyltransferase involved in cell wall biosynthesis